MSSSRKIRSIPRRSPMIRAPPWIQTATGKGSRVAGRTTLALIAQSPTVLYVNVSRWISAARAGLSARPPIARPPAIDPPRNTRRPTCRPIPGPLSSTGSPTPGDRASILLAIRPCPDQFDPEIGTDDQGGRIRSSSRRFPDEPGGTARMRVDQQSHAPRGRVHPRPGQPEGTGPLGEGDGLPGGHLVGQVLEPGSCSQEREMQRPATHHRERGQETQDSDQQPPRAGGPRDDLPPFGKDDPIDPEPRDGRKYPEHPAEEEQDLQI